MARGEATRFISPTRTPLYLAAGRPVVSTSIRDVVSPAGERGLIYIADTVTDMVWACNAALREAGGVPPARADVPERHVMGPHVEDAPPRSWTPRPTPSLRDRRGGSGHQRRLTPRRRGTPGHPS